MALAEPPKANKDDVCDAGGDVKLKEAAAADESDFPASEDPPLVDFFKKSNAPDETLDAPSAAAGVPPEGLLNPAKPENRLGPPS